MEVDRLESLGGMFHTALLFKVWTSCSVFPLAKFSAHILHVDYIRVTVHCEVVNHGTENLWEGVLYFKYMQEILPAQHITTLSLHLCLPTHCLLVV